MKSLLSTGIKAFFTGKKGLESSGVVYGYLYNWHALTGDVDGGDIISNKDIDDGEWTVPSDADFTTLINYVDSTYNVAPNDFGVGNHLKSCRQVNSPLGGDCDTNEHPRWDEDATHYGRDTVDFNILPAGSRGSDGLWIQEVVGQIAAFWTTTKRLAHDAYRRTARHYQNYIGRSSVPFKWGYCSRLFRLTTIEEQALPDGVLENKFYEGNDGKIYRVTKIGTQVWIADNLAETKYYDGTDIPNVTDNTEWSNLTTGARCAYDNDESYV